jgi:hypothetical protein
MIHLQCHFGLGSLSWARKGAAVTAVDFSSEGIALARSLAVETRLDARRPSFAKRNPNAIEPASSRDAVPARRGSPECADMHFEDLERYVRRMGSRRAA